MFPQKKGRNVLNEISSNAPHSQNTAKGNQSTKSDATLKELNGDLPDPLGCYAQANRGIQAGSPFVAKNHGPVNNTKDNKAVKSGKSSLSRRSGPHLQSRHSAKSRMSFDSALDEGDSDSHSYNSYSSEYTSAYREESSNQDYGSLMSRKRSKLRVLRDFTLFVLLAIVVWFCLPYTPKVTHTCQWAAKSLLSTHRRIVAYADWSHEQVRISIIKG